MKEWTVGSSSEGQKVEKFIRKVLDEAPLSFIYKAFRKKDIKVNGHWVKKDRILHHNDVVRIYVTDDQLKDFQKPRDVVGKDIDVPIIYEDENILILDKPSGLLVIGDDKEKRNTLARKVLDYLYFKGEFDPKNHSFVPSPAHRLDRNTGGLVIFGKSDAGLKQLEVLFKERDQIKKEYLALCVGEIEKDGEIDAPLKKDSASGIVKVCSEDKGGKRSLTKYKVKEKFYDATLVQAELITGRTHQIRVHFQSIGHPLVGDGKYGNFQENRKYQDRFNFNRQFLRAYSVTFGNIDGVLANLKGKTFYSHLSPDELRIIESLREEKSK